MSIYPSEEYRTCVLNMLNEELDGIKLTKEERHVMEYVVLSEGQDTAKTICSVISKAKKYVRSNGVSETDHEILDILLKHISMLKPYEWERLKIYVDKKYSSKQASTPMPSIEELRNYSDFDFPNIKFQQPVRDKD